MVKKIFRFIKIEHTAFSLPLLFTGAWFGNAQRWPGGKPILLIVLAAVGARIFGMSFNRIFDRHLDAQNPRTANRELPSGAMRVSSALMVALAGLAVYLLACALLGGWCLALAPIPLVPLLGYSILKRYTLFCHFGIGLCLALAPLGAFVAAAGHPQFSIQIWLFSAYVFFWLSGADIIYALLDIESDRRTGIHSIPAALGYNGAQLVSAGVHVMALFALAALLFFSSARWAAWAGYGVTLLFFILMYVPSIPIGQRFFPLATLAGVAGAVTPMLL